MKIQTYSLAFLVSLAILSGCSKSSEKSSNLAGPAGPLGPVISAGAIPSDGSVVTLSNGAQIFLQKREGILFYKAEGTFTPEYFSQILSSAAYKTPSERKAILSSEVDQVLSQVKNIKGVELISIPEVGYFSFEAPYLQADFMSPLKALPCSKNILVNPVVYDKEALETIHAYGPDSEGLVAKSGSRLSNKGFSGLERVHATEFVKQAEADIGGGVEVDGSLVNVGVTDTGISFYHPNFLSKDETRSRVTYMRDFTREGRVYFNKNARFEVSASQENPEELVLHAEVLITPPLPYLPAGDRLTEVKELVIKVSPELRSILTQPGSGAKLGILNEAAFQNPSEPVDINGNGKLDDLLYVILIPGKTVEEDVIYFDPSGKGDFRNTKPLGDWNKTKQTMVLFSEKVGFDFRDDILPTSKGDGKISVRSVSVVGFDPGNHGSHVAGIIAGRRTLQNDKPTTLARGIAPQANILMNRVCANNGGCNATAAFVDLVVNGGADVINMSLGGLNPFNDGYGVQETLINRITSNYNVLFVISAGNSGPGRQTVGAPSTARLALSVGATANRDMIQRQYQWPGLGTSDLEKASDDQDFMLFFSSRGPTAAGGFKPNLTAPGTELSSIQLNSAPGSRGGLDVYWGTSMAAPAAAGSYALLLDAVRKYNLKNPSRPLPAEASVLREVLIHTARPFDVSRYNPETGELLQGQYTWVDEGTGMIDLTAAWKKLMELRDQSIPTAVNQDGKSVELDYQVIVPMKAPNGNVYDGSKPGAPGNPAFGAGVYLSSTDTEMLRQVSITRRLPEKLAASGAAGELMRQLKTTGDEFVLKTVIYGSNKPWIKIGSLDQLGCRQSENPRLTVAGEGAVIQLSSDGTGTLNPSPLGTLNLCIDRNIISKELTPGDHGALIYGYRTVNGQLAPLPSFVVPVYLTVPHQTLENSTAYEIQGEVSSFGVNRNYIQIPKGTSLVRVTLEVPSIKVNSNGVSASDFECSGVELMALAGKNTAKPFKTRLDARTSNCDALGRPLSGDQKKTVTFSQANPTPGIWDLAVFGNYKFLKSKYKLRVDYFVAVSSQKEIKGPLSALNGNMTLSIKESSMDLRPDLEKSGYYLFGLQSEISNRIRQGEQLVLPASESSVLRKYAADVKKVIVKLGGSPGNDLDLFVIECNADAANENDASCKSLAKSDGPTDEEMLSFVPKRDKAYGIRVDGVDIKESGAFTCQEALVYQPEKGTLAITQKEGVKEGSEYEVGYSFDPSQLQTSKLLNEDNFKVGKFEVIGALLIKAQDSINLSGIPVNIKKQ